MENEKHNQLEVRIEKLENAHLRYEENYIKILDILKKLEGKLVGSIETDSPGLLSQVRLTKERVAEHDVKLLLIESKLPSAESMSEIKSLKEEVQKLSQYRWMVYGVMVVIGYLINIGLKFIK